MQSGKAQVQEVLGHAAQDQKQIWTSSLWITHPGSVHKKCYSRNRLLTVVIDNTVYHLSVKNK